VLYTGDDVPQFEHWAETTAGNTSMAATAKNETIFLDIKRFSLDLGNDAEYQTACLDNPSPTFQKNSSKHDSVQLRFPGPYERDGSYWSPKGFPSKPPAGNSLQVSAPAVVANRTPSQANQAIALPRTVKVLVEGLPFFTCF